VRVLLALIVLVYLVIATLYAVKTPAWQVPDEPAQYNYMAQVYKNGCCPKMEPGDWDNDYLETIKAARFAPSTLGRFDAIQYEDHQPPLYYLLVLPVYAVSGGSLTLLRLVSVLMGAGVVILAWAAVQTVFPAQPWLALATAAFVAFLPQHVFMMSGVENDSLAELIVALTLFLSMVYISGKRQIHPLILGLLMGAAFVTKLTVYLPVVGVIGLAVLLRARRECWPMGRLIRQAAWVLVPALLIGSVWWARNIITYGSVADFMVQKTHDAVVVGQPRTDDYQAQHGGVGGWLRDGVSITFHSFWGQFGWMGVPMPDPFYTGLLAFTVFVIIGALIAAIRWHRALNVIQREELLLLGTAAFLAFAAFAGYNFKFVQFQGRYLYPGLIPIGLFVATGLAGWASLVASRFPAARWLTAGLVCLLALLDIYALYRFILPMLA
jgi:hypothetical protein